MSLQTLNRIESNETSLKNGILYHKTAGNNFIDMNILKNTITMLGTELSVPKDLTIN